MIKDLLNCQIVRKVDFDEPHDILVALGSTIFLRSFCDVSGTIAEINLYILKRMN